MKILAIDSGLERTGYAIFENSHYQSSGLVKTAKTKTKEKRLEEIYESFRKIVRKNKPDKIVLERLFFFRNQTTAITVSQAQGVILLLAAQNNMPVEFLTPLQIKSIITGYGKADKKAVQKMIALIPNIPCIKQDDEADAVACGLAYCYLNRNLIK